MEAGQSKIIKFGKPIIGDEEKNAVLEVLNSDILVHGPKAVQFEQDFCAFTKSPYAVSVSSCTAGLHLAYFHMGIGAGDEVIVPAMSHVATAHAPELAGATPVFVDVELETGNIDIDAIEAKITPKTKAITIVHFLGMPVDMDRIMALANKYNLKVVEDCALAMGTYYKGKHAGLFGDMGCFSFYPAKHFTTAEGGIITAKTEEDFKGLSRKKAFGVDRLHEQRKVPGVYDVDLLGFNYRMNEIQAAIGVEQLKKLDWILETRTKNYHHLEKGLLEIPEVKLFKSTHGDFQSSYYCLSMILNDKLAAKRTDIIDYLNANGVGTSVYYPRPIPEFTYYTNKYNYKPGEFKNAGVIAYNSIALPVAQHLDTSDMDYIIANVKNAVSKFS